MRMNDEIRYDDKMHILQEYKLPYIQKLYNTAQRTHTHTYIHTYVLAKEPHTRTPTYGSYGT